MIIKGVAAKGPAALAGVKVNDVVRKIDGEPVKDNQDLLAKIASRKPGETVKLEIVRGGETIKIDVTLTTRPAMSADDLRRQTDQFSDLNDLRDEIGRDPSERRERAPGPAPRESFEDFADI